MDLKKVSTRELVEELSKREAVETISVKPYEKYVIEADGKKHDDEGRGSAVAERQHAYRR